MIIIPSNTKSSRSNKFWLRLISALCVLMMTFVQLPAPAQAAGDRVTFGYLAAYGTKINPFTCTERDMVSIGSLMYESLFEMDSHLQPQPLLAETWSCVDGVWTINIRSGVLFHNGVEMVAEDIVQSFYNFRSADSENPYYSRVSKIDYMTATDTFTLEVKCDYTGMLALYCLTFPVVQRDTAYADVPMGTGPFWCTGFVPDESVRLEANPFWWKQQPNVSTLDFIHYWDISDMLTALQTGEIELFQTRSYTAALTKKLSFATYLDYSTTSYDVLIPNMAGIMGDLNVRKAVMYAIDYDTLMSNVYLNMGQQCEVPIPPASWLYESRSAVYYYSPERALYCLNDSGWYDLTGDTMLNKVEDNVLLYVDINILVYDEPTSTVRRNAAYQIAENLRSVGVNATVEVLDRREVRKRMEDGNFDLALVSLNFSEVPDLIPLLSNEGKINYSGVTNNNLDTMLKNCASAEDEQAMKLAYSNIQSYIVENLPVMGICFRNGMVLSTRPTAGLTPSRETDAYSGIEFMAD